MILTKSKFEPKIKDDDKIKFFSDNKYLLTTENMKSFQ